VIVNRATPDLRKYSDLLIELALDVPEFARYAVTAIPAHLMGTAVGLRKGLNPDAPKNLTRPRGIGLHRQQTGRKGEVFEHTRRHAKRRSPPARTLTL